MEYLGAALLNSSITMEFLSTAYFFILSSRPVVNLSFL